MAEEAGLTVDMEGYQRAMEAARAEAKAVGRGTEVVALFASDKSFPEEVTPASGEVGVILKDTSFYAESGGQVADQGVLVLGDAR